MSDAAAGEADEAVEPDDPTADDSADEIRDEELPEPTPLEIAEAAREMYLADLQRVSAEFANFRKQAGKRNHEVAGRARARRFQRPPGTAPRARHAAPNGAATPAPAPGCGGRGGCCGSGSSGIRRGRRRRCGRRRRR